jgi:catechol 2,3-dioxygenase-like lactoylglutathione lyase family enzyme
MVPEQNVISKYLEITKYYLTEHRQRVLFRKFSKLQRRREIMRMQLALNVDDLDLAIDYYGRLFGVPLNKREPGYANFVVDTHNLKLVLFERPGEERLNHVGFEVFDDAEVDHAVERLGAAEVLAEEQHEEVCCYARQNKAVSYDPQGLMWEWYRVLEDSPTFFEEKAAGAAEGAEPAVACAQSGGCC